MRFADSEHGRQEALFLCTAWCQRMSALHTMWTEAACSTDFWQADMEVLFDDLELVEALLAADQESELYRRGMAIRAIIPGPYVPNWASKGRKQRGQAA